MLQILAFTRKELQLWAQKPGSWIVVFVVPLIFIWIIQAVFGSSGTPVVSIFAVDLDQSPESARVMQALNNSANLRIDELSSREEADQRVSAGDHMAALVIPEGFGAAIATSRGGALEIIVDPARSDQASIVTGLVNAALGPLMIDAEVNRGVEAGIAQVMENFPTSTPRPGPTPVATPPPAPLQKFFTAALKGVVSSQVEEALADPQVRIDPQPLEEVAGGPSHQPSLLDYLVPGYSLMFVFFLISNLAMSVLEERETGAFRRLLVAPVPLSRILLGKMFPYYLLAVVQFTLILIASKLIFAIDLGNSILGLGIIILASSLSIVTLGILITAFARSESQGNGLATVLVLAMAVVSGAMFPSISIPGLRLITPHYWAMQGFLNIIARGQSAHGALLPAGVLIIMSAIFFTIGALRFRFE